MTYEYTLADKMKKQFYGRGASLSGMQASSTSELVRRAEMGRDPRVNCAEQAFCERYGNGQGRVRREYTPEETMYTSVYTTVSAKNTAKKQNSSSHSGTSNSERKANAPQNRGSNNNNKDMRKTNKQESITPGMEIRVKKKVIPPVFVAMLLVSTLMIMFLVMSISEIYETTNEIAMLEEQIATLKADAEDLKIQLEEKNDIRVIEEIATTQLGMTKEDSTQRKYVSLSDGERIDIIEVETDEETGGVLLSSIFSAIGDFFGGNN